MGDLNLAKGRIRTLVLVFALILGLFSLQLFRVQVIEAGNYKKGKVTIQGLNISIENPQGSVRKGISPDGSKWENTLAAHYGYIRGTEGNDGDHVDTFIGPKPESQKVFVIDQVNKEVAESLGLSKAQGALVRGVEQGSPAEKAGLEPGDIILKFEGKTIEKSSDLPRMVGNTKPGTRSAIQVWRRGSMKDMHITVGEFETDKPVKKAATEEKHQGAAVTKVLGLTVSELTDAQKKELKLRGGVRVDAVAEPASRAGIQEGDVILALANIETPNVQALEALTAKLDRSKPVSLLIRRGEWAQYTVIRPAR